MKKVNSKNERIKRAYLTYLKEAGRKSVASVDQVAAAIAEFERYAKRKDFALFHIEQARGFKVFLADQRHPNTGKPLAVATVHSKLMALKAFFIWLADRPGYKSRIHYTDADYFNPSANDSRIATATRNQPAPTLEQIRHVLDIMPGETDIQRRDKAIVAFTIVTGARDAAIASLRLKHVDLATRSVFQDGREINTKNRKTFTTTFFPVGADIETIVCDWVAYLKSDKLFGPDAPLFPSTRVALNEGGMFGAAGLTRSHWKNANAIRAIFRKAFEAAGLPYSNPHLFRNTLVQLGQTTCRTPEEFKAWSQNLGHEQVLTTFTSYGSVATQRQAEIISSFSSQDGAAEPRKDDFNQLAVLIKRLQNRG